MQTEVLQTTRILKRRTCISIEGPGVIPSSGIILGNVKGFHDGQWYRVSLTDYAGRFTATAHASSFRVTDNRVGA